MKVLVVGATGKTGRLLVRQLLERGHNVRAIVRSAARLPPELRAEAGLEVVEASLLGLDDSELRRQVHGCTAVASCLGHVMGFRGIWGPPYRLVTRAVRRLCEAIRAKGAGRPTRFVLMSSSGVRNRDLAEPLTLAHRVVIGLLRLLVPPHPDNEQAAEYLRTRVGRQDPAIEWVAVRPDGLVDEDEVTPYEAHPSPLRSAIFDAGKVSRVDVAHFMASLVTDDELWSLWSGRMPVLYGPEPDRSPG